MSDLAPDGARRVAPYGTWTSPLSARDIAADALRLSSVVLDGGDVYWLEGRPADGGRNVVVRREATGRITDVTPEDANVRTRVHEYGGGAFAVAGGTVFYANFADQRLYRLAVAGADGAGDSSGDAGAARAAGRIGRAEPLTPPGRWCYADFAVDVSRGRLVCVREDHASADREAVTTLVSVPLAGGPSEGTVIASGYDFYSTPRLSPDGSRLAWLCWRHPQMPWDGAELWVADVTDDAALANGRRVAGGEAESVYQPGWGSDGVLYFVSDRTGWWQISRYQGGAVTAVLPTPPPESECGRPQWTFGTATWVPAGPERLLVSYTRRGRWRLATIDTVAGTQTDVATELEPLEWIAATPTHAVWIAASPVESPAVARTNLATGVTELLRLSAPRRLGPDAISAPDAITFPTDGGRSAHAFFYPPCNPRLTAPADERPPVIVISHGGPTTAAVAALSLQVQFWTSRGFGVVDVNYGGSSGYGRPYRQRLNGQWGIVDVADVVQAARYLVAQGRADARRLVIRGASAGGYTTLAALTGYPDVFGAGASYYGVSDVEALAQDTHKFEARYLDTLIGPYPATRDLYRARSPIHVIDRLACPLILFQGLDDKVVPPDQSRRVAEAARAKGLPVELHLFEGEQHGFRKAETIVRCLEAELAFYGRVFGFTPAI